MASNGGSGRSSRFLAGCAVLVGLAAAFVLVVSLIPWIVGGAGSLATAGRDKVAVVELFGPIMDSTETVRLLQKYTDDTSIKGILVHINSPGGGVAASQEIYQAVRTAKEKKPVVASMSSVAASGGYYVALGADEVVANPGTLTGSIGVIIAFMDSRELFGKLGLKTIVVKAGEYKDIGAGNREFTDADRAVIQGVIDDVYRQFVEAVAESRDMEYDEVKQLADGRIYSGQQALDLGMIDTLGTYNDAVKILADKAGIKGKPAIIKEEEQFGFLKGLLSEKLGIVERLNNRPETRPGLHYLWAGY